MLAGYTDAGGGYPSGITVCLGNGDGTFQAGTFYQVADSQPGQLGYAALGDFNGDGILDVVASGSSGVWLWTGKGGGSFNAGVLVASLPSGGGYAATADFNRDGKLDLVVTMPNSMVGFAILLGNGDDTFRAPIMFSQPGQAFGLAAGPLAKDGPPGIAVSGGSNFYLYYGDGAGHFSGPHLIPVPASGYIVLGDLDGDGSPDLVCATGYVSYGTASGTFRPPVHYPIENSNVGRTWNVVLADLTHSGRLDILTDNYTANSVLLNLGNRKFEDGIWYGVSGGTGCAAIADFNRDGKPDLAVNGPSSITILLGTGSATKPFTTGTTISVPHPGCPLAGDLNGDGIPDLLVPVNFNPNGLLTYLGDGQGGFTRAAATPTPNAGGFVVLADFNHDGKLDFATSGNLIAYGNGNGSFQTPVPIVSNPPNSGFSGIAAGDINKDGWPDLVLTNSGISPYYNAFVLLNNQHGGFIQVPTDFGLFTAQPILTGLNGDGNLDLVLGYPGGSGALFYLGDGTGTFVGANGVPGVFSVFNGYNVVADLNGDGIPDIVVLGADTLLIYVGLGNVTYAPAFGIGTGPSPGQVLVENLHGQPPSKGIPDIVVPDTSGGVMVLVNQTK